MFCDHVYNFPPEELSTCAASGCSICPDCKVVCRGCGRDFHKDEVADGMCKECREIEKEEA
jgi:hypothetical protein